MFSSTSKLTPYFFAAALKNDGTLTYDSVSPLITELINDINAATTALGGISSKRSVLASRQSGDELADLVAEIVEVRALCSL